MHRSSLLQEKVRESCAFLWEGSLFCLQKRRRRAAPSLGSALVLPAGKGRGGLPSLGGEPFPACFLVGIEVEV